MEKEQRKTTRLSRLEDVNWDELAGIGIIEGRAGNVGRTRHVAQGGENECDTAQPGAAWCGRGDGRHATAGAQGRRTAARNPRHQTHRTTVAPPYI